MNKEKIVYIKLQGQSERKAIAKVGLFGFKVGDVVKINNGNKQTNETLEVIGKTLRSGLNNPDKLYLRGTETPHIIKTITNENKELLKLVVRPSILKYLPF